MESKVIEFENTVKNLFITEGIEFDDISTEFIEGEIISIKDDFTGEDCELEVDDEIVTTVVINEVLTMDFFDKISELINEFTLKYRGITFWVDPTTENL